MLIGILEVVVDPLFREYGDALDFDATPKEVTPVVLSFADPDSLQRSQRRAFDLIADHYEDLVSGVQPKQMLIHIYGNAGTGKSYLIDTVSAHLAECAQSETAVVRRAPTGIAAHNISGRTSLRLPVRSKCLSSFNFTQRNPRQPAGPLVTGTGTGVTGLT